jgi:hypothetical protein
VKTGGTTRFDLHGGKIRLSCLVLPRAKLRLSNFVHSTIRIIRPSRHKGKPGMDKVLVGTVLRERVTKER